MFTKLFGNKNADYEIKDKVSILIPTMFDSRYIIELCIKSIRKYTKPDTYQIIVCDAGVDDETRRYLNQLDNVQLIKATDWMRPKDDLAAAVTTKYYLLMHDDLQITSHGWLEKRVCLMEQDENNAIVGAIVKNYHKTKRFFPLGLLVKTDASRELDLKWGKQPEAGYDTGALAYEKFIKQSRYKFVKCKINPEIHHFSSMTWPKYKTRDNTENLDTLLDERQMKIETIKKILAEDDY
jgi:glycosyltransferase involved in cell wall biosynthesis